MNKIIFLLFISIFFIASKGLAEDKTIQLATLKWEPYVGEELVNYGFTAEIVAEGFKRAGYRVNIDFMSWARVLKSVESGDYDAMFPAYYSPEREEIYAMSSSFLEGPLGFCKRKDADIVYRSLVDLKPYRIGIVRGYVNTEEFDNADYLQKFISNNDRHNLKMLDKKRLDLIVIDKFTFKFIIQNELPHLEKRIEFIHPPLEIKTLHVGLSRKMKNYELVLKQFNKAIKEMTEDGTIINILKKHNYLN